MCRCNFKHLLLLTYTMNLGHCHEVTLNLCCPPGHIRNVTSETRDVDPIMRCFTHGLKVVSNVFLEIIELITCSNTSLVNLLTLKKYLFNIHYLRMSSLQTRLKDSILLSNYQRFTQTFPLSWTTNSFDCPNKSPLFHLDEYYPTYSIDPDGTITASYPLNNSTVFEVISKENYCIDHDSLVLFCVPEQGDVCPELVSSPWGIFHIPCTF